MTRSTCSNCGNRRVVKGYYKGMPLCGRCHKLLIFLAAFSIVKCIVEESEKIPDITFEYRLEEGDNANNTSD